ncbi:MAG: diaminopimelate decarboxylase [Acidobacteriota bacterium]
MRRVFLIFFMIILSLYSQGKQWFLEEKTHLGINEKNHLTIGGVDVVNLAEEFGTPLYVIDGNRIIERYKEFLRAFDSLYPKVEIKYAYKANTSLAVLKILKNQGAGADIVSGGELYVAMTIGLAPEKIIFTGNNKTDEELRMALDAGVIINFDSIHEMERLKKICAEKKKIVRVSFRVNPSVSPETHPHLATGLWKSKFGIHEDSVLEAYKSAKGFEYFKISGIHMHIGSQILDSEPYKEATSKLMDLAGKLKNHLGVELDFIDVGGGVGIRYKKDMKSVPIKNFAEDIVKTIKEKIKEYNLKQPLLYLEPGRWIVGDAGILLTRVSTIKKTPFKKFIGVDAGFNTLVRPVLYDAYHEVVLANRVNEKSEEEVYVAGNLCESGDILAKDRLLPKVEENDLLAFLDAGAYAISMASAYNSRPFPAEVLVLNGKYYLIRERESYKDLLRNQLIPEFLK